MSGASAGARPRAGAGAPRAAPGAGCQCVAALGLADVTDAEIDVGEQPTREAVQVARVAVHQLDLEFVDRLAASAGLDAAGVHSELGEAAGMDLHGARAAPEAGLERRGERRAHGRIAQPCGRGGVGQGLQIGYRGAHRDLVFLALVQSGVHATAGLECLDPAPADPPHTQGDAGPGQGEFRCVEVDAAQGPHQRGRALRLAQYGAAREAPQGGGFAEQLEFDLHAADCPIRCCWRNALPVWRGVRAGRHARSRRPDRRAGSDRRHPWSRPGCCPRGRPAGPRR